MNNGKRFTTTIRRKHWQLKLKDIETNGFFWEYKNKIDHWVKRINGLEPPCDGVFLVGKEEHRVLIIEIREFRLSEIPLYCFEEIHTETCYGLKCVIPNEALMQGSKAASWDCGLEVPYWIPYREMIKCSTR